MALGFLLFLCRTPFSVKLSLLFLTGNPHNLFPLLLFLLLGLFLQLGDSLSVICSTRFLFVPTLGGSLLVKRFHLLQ